MNMECFSVVFLLLIGFISPCVESLSPSRLCVIENRVGNQRGMLAFLSATPATVLVSYGNSETASAAWGTWKSIGAPLASPPLSNPSCVHSEGNQTEIFVQASDGQVYMAVQDGVEFLKFSSWEKVGSNAIPVISPQRSVLVDSVSAHWYGTELMVFARSISNASQLYFCKGNSSSFGAWGLVAGTTILGTDVTIIRNPFVNKYEAFMLSTGGKMHRTWQHNAKGFAGWKTMASAPTFSTVSRPTAEIMGHTNIFNGKVMVGGIGKDNYVHRCWQTTCDVVDNPWSYCTWGSWYRTGGEIPFTWEGVQNNLAMSRNVHFGVEIFGVQDTTGQLWQAWQLNSDASWNPWTKIPQDLTRAALINNPYIHVNNGGWWMAYGLNATNQVIVMEPARSLNATPESVAWANNLTASWSVAVDEATNMDWVAIFPYGASNDQYVDYRYVQGGLNPGKHPVSSGNVSMVSYLPNGSYQVRYLVNKKYVSIVKHDVTYYNESHASELLQIYEGIFTGLGAHNKATEVCLNDSLLTIETFEAAFKAFENVKIFEGLQLLGTALQDVVITLRACGETYIAEQLVGFVIDLIECTEGYCLNFFIDVLEEIVIVYENEYEIYGDIKGASNSFNLLKAYQQGGLCIGRFVKACFRIDPPPGARRGDIGRGEDIRVIRLDGHLKWNKND